MPSHPPSKLGLTTSLALVGGMLVAAYLAMNPGAPHVRNCLEEAREMFTDLVKSIERGLEFQDMKQNSGRRIGSAIIDVLNDADLSDGNSKSMDSSDRTLSLG